MGNTRGRPPKNKPATPEQLSKIENMLGEPLDEFVKTFTDENKRKMYANNLARQLKKTELLTSMSSSNGTYQPIYSEQLFQKIGVNPVAASSADIEKWLLAPQYFDQNLRHLSQYLSYAVGQYNRAIWYLNTIKAFNYTIEPCDDELTEDFDEKQFLKDYNTCLNTLRKLNVKYQLAKVDLDVMYNGISFMWISETNDTISLLPIPADYCYITSPWTYGYLFAIDLVFFDQFISIPQQIPELIEAYKVFVEKRKDALKGEDLAPFQYYAVPPQKGFCFTFNPIMPDKTPPLIGSMGASLDVLSYKELLKNQLALNLYKIIAMKIPLDKDNKQMAITYKLAEEITQTIQSLLPENIKAYSSPFESTPVNTDQSNRFSEIVDISNDTFYAGSGLSKSLFGSKETKQASALKISSEVDFNYASSHSYRQYENFIDWILNSRVKKYHFKTNMFGNALNKKEEVDQAANNMVRTNSGVRDYFASKGKEPFQIKGSLLLEEALGLKKLMTPIISAFNSKNIGNDKGGRPEENDVSEAGEITRDNDSNENRM